MSPELSDAQKPGWVADTIEIFLAHLGSHPARIVVEHDRQVRCAINGKRMQRVLARGRLRIGGVVTSNAS